MANDHNRIDLGAKPNEEAEKLIKEAQKALDINPFSLVYKSLAAKWGDGIPTLLGKKEASEIDKDERATLEKMNSSKAKILINDDGKGAIILSSSGSTTYVGNRSISGNKDAQKQREYIQEKIFEDFKDGTIHETEKADLEKLDEILPGVIMVVADDNKSAEISDLNGVNWHMEGDMMKKFIKNGFKPSFTPPSGFEANTKDGQNKGGK